MIYAQINVTRKQGKASHSAKVGVGPCAAADLGVRDHLVPLPDLAHILWGSTELATDFIRA